jgi:hypothetical protein
VQSYQKYVENLPIRDSPEVFGMHENANINFQAQESDRIMAVILSIQPRISGRYVNYYEVRTANPAIKLYRS